MSAAIRDEKKTLKCPRDSTELTALSESTRGILLCPTCDGMWIKKAHFRDLFDGRDLRPSSRGIGSASPVIGRRHPPISCPVDHAKPMIQKAYDGIQVDICGEHEAFWLDGGEYDKLLIIHEGKNPQTGRVDRDSRVFVELAADLAVEVASNPEVILGLGELSSEIAEAIFEFVLEVLADAF